MGCYPQLLLGPLGKAYTDSRLQRNRFDPRLTLPVSFLTESFGFEDVLALQKRLRIALKVLDEGFALGEPIQARSQF
jgi:hypothetical protein